MMYLHYRSTKPTHVQAITPFIDGIITLNKNPLKFCRALISQQRLIVSANDDIYSWILIFLLLRRKHSAILHISSFKMRILYKYMLRTIIKTKNVKFAFTTSHVANEFCKSLGIDRSTVKHSVVFHYSSIFDFPANNSLCKKKFDFLYLGRLDVRRGCHEFMKLAEAYPNYRFAMAGDGALVGSVREKSAELANLFYFGFATGNDKIELIDASRCLISLMKKTENFGISLAECLVRGTPIVCPNDFGPKELIGLSFKGYEKTLLDEFSPQYFIEEICLNPRFMNRDLALDLSRDALVSRWMEILND